MPRRLPPAPVLRVAALLLGTGLMLSCGADGILGPPGNRKPTASITVASDPLLEGSEIAFDASNSSDADYDTLTYRWDLRDGFTRTEARAARTYLDEGEYDVTLVVTDQHGVSDTATARISVDNAAPEVSTLVTPAGAVDIGTPTAIRVAARDLGITDSLSIQIDWKDGSTSTLACDSPAEEISVAHTYLTTGTYSVAVTVRDNDGGVGVRTGPILVVPPHQNRAPTARIQVPSGNHLEGSPLILEGRTSSDPDGDSLTYVWDLGDQLQWTGPQAVRTYVDDGIYSVRLIATDQHGASDTATTQVTIENRPPFIYSTRAPSGAILAGTSMTIEVSASDSGQDSLTMQIDWKDGSTYTSPKRPWYQGGVKLDHTYATPGTYAVEATSRDDDGGVTKGVVGPILVVGPHTNHPPVARIDGPSSGSEGAGLFFSGKNSTDPDGDSLKITLLTGDGRKQDEPRYYYSRLYGDWLRYPDNGTYIVSVIVTDDSGAADTASMPVTVENVPPTVSWYSVPLREAAGIAGSVQVRVEDQGTGDQQSILVDWGDGTGQTVGVADTSIWYAFEGRHILAGTIFHTYATTGAYSITVTARDDDGGVSAPIVSSNPVVVFNANERRTIGGYEVMDLGTLGGNAARPEDINDRGQVVGTSLTGTWDDHAFLWDASGMHDLGTMGHEGSEAIRINKDGVIAGTVWTHTTGIPGHNEISLNIGTIWENSVPRALDSTHTILTAGVSGGYCSGPLFSLESPRVVRAMSNSGDVAWASYSRWCTTGWLWRNGSWRRLPSHPMAMNDRGQVVGASARGESPWYYHAFLAEGGTSRELGVLAPLQCDGQDCSMAMATDLNESGQVVGISTDGTGRYHFVLWHDDQIRDLGTADWIFPQHAAPHVVINDRGEIAGSVAGKAFFWNADSMITLPSAGGSIAVVGLNENGYVAGTIQTGAEQHAFVWSVAQGMVDLGTGPDGFSGAWVVDINARGDVLGYTAPCRAAAGNRCADNTRNPDSLKGTQVRAILWRKQ